MMIAFEKLRSFARRTSNNSWARISLLACGLLLILYIVFEIGIFKICEYCYFHDSAWCKKYPHALNLGGKDFGPRLTFGPIDVVYTWVNGSDERWREERKRWMAAHFGEAQDEDEGARSSNASAGARKLSYYSGFDSDYYNFHGYDPDMDMDDVDYFWHEDLNAGSNSSNNATEDDNHREEDGENRFRDSNELKYSLRSLEKYAPWVRHVYLVTNGQIPKWLDLRSKKLTVITHKDIFLNASHLPVFSSPAIEAHLHRIPGLSKKFIYFNDDVFLGAPVWPEDFYFTSGKQKVFLSWDVPPCADGCFESYIGDGFCDRACNVSDCNFDNPDCVNKTEYSNRYGYSGQTYGMNQNDGSCKAGCPTNWLGDGVCDRNCNNLDCAFDGGDCGIALVYEHLQGGLVEGETGKNATHTAAHLNVDIGQPAVYLNLSQTLMPPENVLQMIEAWHDNPAIVRESIFIKKFNMLIILFKNKAMLEEEHVMLPQNISASIEMVWGESNVSVNFHALLIVNSDTEELHSMDNLGLPESLSPLHFYHTTCNKNLSNLSPLVGNMTKIANDSKVMAHVQGNISEYGPLFLIPLQHPKSWKCNVSREAIFLQSLRMPNDTYIDGRLSLQCPGEEQAHRLTPELFLLLPNPWIIPQMWITMDLKLLPYSKEQQSRFNASQHFETQISHYVLACSHMVIRWGAKDVQKPTEAQSQPPKLSPISSQDWSEWSSLEEIGGPPPNQRRGLRSLSSIMDVQSGATKVNIRQARDRNHRYHKGKGITAKRRLRQRFLRRMSATSAKDMSSDNKINNFLSFWGKNIHHLESHFQNAEMHLDPPFGFWLNMALGLQLQNEISTTAGEPSSTATKTLLARPRRHLMDSFGASLRHVNNLYNELFGKASETRKVIAHMPHMVDKEIMEEMQQIFHDEWDTTSMNRFRSSNDMQYAFAYFYYLMNRYRLREEEVLWEWWTDSLDTDQNGYLEDNELLTLVILIHGKTGATELNLAELKECLGIDDTQKATFSNLINCKTAVTTLMDKGRRDPEYHIDDDTFIAFEMLDDNEESFLNKVNWIRERRPKFFCLNDNMKHPSDEIQYQLWAFFESYFPQASQFELGSSYINRFQYIEDYENFNRFYQVSMAICFVVLCCLLCLEMCRGLFGGKASTAQHEVDHVGKTRPHLD